MSKTYSQKAPVASSMKPKKEVVSFLLNYSKALRIIKVGKMKVEVIIN